MPPSTRPRPSTNVLTQAGEVVQTVSPRSLFTLVTIADENPQTQGDIAERVGSARSTISKYLLSLENLPQPLATKGRQQYEITELGRIVVGLLDEMIGRLGVDINAINWQVDTDVERVAEKLSPLCDSRTNTPVFVLEALRFHSETVDLLDTPRPVSVDDIVSTVSQRHTDRGENITAEQVHSVLRRFAEEDAIEIVDDECNLTTKGKEHACLLSRIVGMLENNDSRDNQAGGDQTAVDSQSPSPSGSKRVANQLDPRQFTGGSDLTNDQESNDPTSPRIIPAYWLVQASEAKNISSQSAEVLPLTTMAPEQLIDHISMLLDGHDNDSTLVPYWTLQMGGEFHPIERAELSIDDINPWELLMSTSTGIDSDQV